MLAFVKTANKQAGDTLIEVLFAIVIFSLIVVSSIMLMNQGIASSQRSLQITAARQQMDGQAETLRFLHESYVEAYQPGATSYPAGSPAAEYYKIIQFAQAGGRASASEFGGATECAVPADPGKDFILNPVTATLVTTAMKSTVFQQADGFAEVTFTAGNVLDQSRGIWVEAVRSGTATASAGYIDFHIRACWDAPGTNLPMNLGTIVRLYEPRG